jgi:tetratricopeptide (TPR) repeat protein
MGVVEIVSAHRNRTLLRTRTVIGVLVTIAVIVPLTSRTLAGQRPAPDGASADALFESGASSLKAGKYKEAEEAFRKLSDLEPSNSRGLMGLVSVYTAQKKYDQAIQLLQAEISKDPSRSDYRLAIGTVATVATQYDLALKEFLWVLNHTNRADRFSKTAGYLNFRIGQVYLLKGELDFSIIFLRQAKELLPGDPSVLSMLGLVLDQGGKKDEAALEYRTILSANPDNPEALNNLAFLLADSGRDLDTALKYAQRASQLQPNSPAVADTLGWVYLKKSRTDEAIAALRGAVQKMPTRSTFHYHLALALEQKGDHSAALEELKTALKSTPPKDEEQKLKELLQKLSK